MNESNVERDSDNVLTSKMLDDWATRSNGPVALHLKQRLLSVEGEDGVIFPPTYADIGYNIDTLSDGTRVATIDSFGSQANRMEPIFLSSLSDRDKWLVPQVEIVINANGPKAKRGDGAPLRKLSLLDLAHRGADAVAYSTHDLSPLLKKAFAALRGGDAGPLCEIAPTSLVFGVWDSRGGTGEKRPRLVRAVIRAWEVDPLHAAAQFNSVAKVLEDDDREELEKYAKAKKKKLSTQGFADAPAIFRKVSGGAAKQMPEFDDGRPNPKRRVLGGVVVRGRIQRDITINLVALRGLRGATSDDTAKIHKYLLGLSLIAATAEIDLFLREGCNLRYTADDVWNVVPRRAEPTQFRIDSGGLDLLRRYTSECAAYFRPKWPKELQYQFDVKLAKELIAEQQDEDSATESS